MTMAKRYFVFGFSIASNCQCVLCALMLDVPLWSDTRKCTKQNHMKSIHECGLSIHKIYEFPSYTEHILSFLTFTCKISPFRTNSTSFKCFSIQTNLNVYIIINWTITFALWSRMHMCAENDVTFIYIK